MYGHSLREKGKKNNQKNKYHRRILIKRWWGWLVATLSSFRVLMMYVHLAISVHREKVQFSSHNNKNNKKKLHLLSILDQQSVNTSPYLMRCKLGNSVHHWWSLCIHYRILTNQNFPIEIHFEVYQGHLGLKKKKSIYTSVYWYHSLIRRQDYIIVFVRVFCFC